jgi:hypothetical protein
MDANALYRGVLCPIRHRCKSDAKLYLRQLLARLRPLLAYAKAQISCSDDRSGSLNIGFTTSMAHIITNGSNRALRFVSCSIW